MENQVIVFSQGRYHEQTEPAVPLNNSGFLHGYGVFTTLRLYDGRAPFLGHHMERLASHAKALDLPAAPDQDEIQPIIDHLVQANQLGKTHARLRISLTVQNKEGFLTVVPGPLPKLLDRWQSEGIGIITVGPEYQRLVHPELKTLQFLPSLQTLQAAAQKALCPEGVVCMADETVLEGAISNVFLVQGGTLKTTPAEGKILPGLARQRVLDLSDQMGIPFGQQYFRRDELIGAEEVFLTNSVQEILPVVIVDCKKIGPGIPGPITRKFQALYRPED